MSTSSSSTSLKVARGIGAVVMGVITIAGVLVTFREEIPRASARAFADRYFEEVIRDPDAAYPRLTTASFRQLRGGQQPGFSEYWSTARSVRVTAVEPTDPEDWFEMRYEVEYDSGSTESIALRAHLVCAATLRDYSPLHDCRGSDLLLDDVIRSEPR